MSGEALQQVIAEVVREAVRTESNANPTTTRRLPTIEQSSEYLALSKRSIHELLANCQLPGVKYGRKTMIDIRDLDQWIERNKA
jgi:excisionase family DNA binding protein